MTPGDRVLTIELDPHLLGCIDELVAIGGCGDSREAVCGYLIRRGLDDLLRAGVLKPIRSSPMPKPADFAAAIAGGLSKEPASAADPYYYSRGEGAWAVRGPNGFHLEPPGLDKSVAYVIAKLLSGQLGEALAMLRDLPRLPGDRKFGT
jgi:hypothetical protein